MQIPFRAVTACLRPGLADLGPTSGQRRPTAPRSSTESRYRSGGSDQVCVREVPGDRSWWPGPAGRQSSCRTARRSAPSILS